jgi:hypothetical protein
MSDIHKVMTTLIPCHISFGFAGPDTMVIFKVLFWSFLCNLIDWHCCSHLSSEHQSSARITFILKSWFKLLHELDSAEVLQTSFFMSLSFKAIAKVVGTMADLHVLLDTTQN